jgi:hypothetical protein
MLVFLILNLFFITNLLIMIYELFNILFYFTRKSNPNITEWMAMMNFTEYHQLEAYYTNKLLNITKNLNKKATVWQGNLKSFKNFSKINFLKHFN